MSACTSRPSSGTRADMPVWRSRTRATWTWMALVVVAAAGLGGCGPNNDGALPPDVPDPASVKTPAGALARYRGALSFFSTAVDGMVTASGVMTDELSSLPMTTPAPVPNAPLVSSYMAVDARADFGVIAKYNYDQLYKLRAQAREARAFVSAYAADTIAPALQGHLATWEGYGDVFLAELFCSGIPLSTVNADGTYTIAAGSTTNQVLEQARVLFDSALAVATVDSVRNLAAVGKGRALLGLNRYAEAAAAVAAVPDNYVGLVPLAGSVNSPGGVDLNGLPFYSSNDRTGLWSFAFTYGRYLGTPSVADREGGNGLDYRSSGDPRTAAVADSFAGLTPQGDTMYVPAKYTFVPPFALGATIPVTDSFVVASGIEARLIEAEAALQGGGDWLGILNHLRQTAWPLIKPAVSGPLADTTDPGSPAARVDLLFRERAFWLFLTGHRQGDLRRLVRQYGRAPNAVYPSGAYIGGGLYGTYGNETVAQIPDEERQLNSHYTGCFNRNS